MADWRWVKGIETKGTIKGDNDFVLSSIGMGIFETTGTDYSVVGLFLHFLDSNDMLEFIIC
jgi:hypothetical protein